MFRRKMLGLLASVAVGLAAASAVYAANTAVVNNVSITSNGTSWTLAFDLTNTGPAKDAIFKFDIEGISSQWSSYGSNPFTVTGLGATPVNLSDGTGESWSGKQQSTTLSFQAGNGSSTGIYRIFGQPNPPSPNKLKGNSARFTWTFTKGSGPDPSTFVLSPEAFKLHFQLIGTVGADQWANNGRSYVGRVVNVLPEPSSLISLLGLATTALAVTRRARKS